MPLDGETTNLNQGICFTQYPLGQTPVDYDYEYTRCFVIRAETTVAGLLKDLKIWISPNPEAEPNVGTPKTAAEWRKVAEGLPLESAFMLANPPATTLDFSIAKASRVVVMLMGGFWRFSDTFDPLTTKQDLKDRYFDLRRHKKNGLGEIVDIPAGEECRCISFFTHTPLKNVRHPFSLNLDLLIEIDTSEGKKVMPLPITIDPDIENKGGG